MWKFATRSFVVLALIGITAVNAAAQHGRTALNVDTAGVILKGYDVMAYHLKGEAALGSPEFTVTHNGAVYRFASAAHRDQFASAPDRFAPAFGGYCAMGVAAGAKFDIDPTRFVVQEGVLYVNKDRGAQAAFMRALDPNILKARDNWPRVAEQTSFRSPR
jgi:YHS domain-containing protein